MHYQRWWKRGDPLWQPATHSVCTVVGCGKPTRSSKSPHCEMHYGRLRRNGTLENVVDLSATGYCFHCGQALTGEYRGRKFCSGRCQARYYRECPREVACDACGKMFVPMYGATVCSAECREEADRRGWAEYYEREWNSNPAYRDRIKAEGHLRRALKAGCASEPFKDSDIYARDHWRCGICGQPVDSSLNWPNPLAASLDHIVPLARGGPHKEANVQLAHLICNWRKGARDAARAQAEPDS